MIPIDRYGCYCGDDLRVWGIGYEPGEYIPVERRYRATKQWQLAMEERRGSRVPVVSIGSGAYALDVWPEDLI